ncbi:MAG: acyl-CoA thioesterase [Rhodobacteraceae bacterium]|jgi:4-hydroxybenzoyl-CoA thioesterase|nr:acyl-CoA thioesterase [Paracoccaceae bacterium]
MAGLTNRRPVAIEWGDCDPAGIVYYPRYFVMFDNATVALFAAAGLPKAQMVRDFDIVGIPMVDTRARFLIPSRWGETIEIESRVATWKRSSFDIEHRVFKGDALAIEAWETRVWVAHDPVAPGGIRSRPIPDAVKARFA